jgi:hypothetical protein
MRDNYFFINSIKMDLFRIVVATGNLNNPIPLKSVEEFFTHALNDFDKILTSKREIGLKAELEVLKNRLVLISDPIARLKWTEKMS